MDYDFENIVCNQGYQTFTWLISSGPFARYWVKTHRHKDFDNIDES